MEETITLYQFPRSKTVANLSPFCLKVELLMRMTSIPYEVEAILNPAKAPKGKLPYIVHQGRTIPDSSHIFDYLKLHFSLTIDDNLNPEQLAIGHAMSIMLEERLRWCLVYSRWLDECYAPTFQNMFDDFVSFPLKIIFPVLIAQSKKRIANTLNSNGIGQFTSQEIYAFGKSDLEALATILGDKPYLFGDQPSSFDAITYSFLVNLIDVPIESPINVWARKNETLRNYCQRITNNYFSDLF